MHIKKHLSFRALRKSVGEIFHQIDDHRQPGKVDFSLHDCLMSVLAMMFFQDPSVLSFQRHMQQRMQSSNLKTMFAAEAIASDAVSLFAVLFGHLQRGKQHLNMIRNHGWGKPVATALLPDPVLDRFVSNLMAP